MNINTCNIESIYCIYLYNFVYSCTVFTPSTYPDIWKKNTISPSP